jgi:TonB family protein
MNKPIALSIVHPQELFTARHQVEVSAKAKVQPRPVERSMSSERKTVISEKVVAPRELITEETVTVKERYREEAEITEFAADGGKEDRSLDEIPLDNTQGELRKRIDSSPPVRTASIPSDGEGQGAAPQGGRTGADIIVDARPKHKENHLPRYPKLARKRGYEGRTVLRVEVLGNGKVGQIKIASSSGFEVLDKVALESVRDWTFFPGTKNGKPTRQWVMVPVRFSLR